MNWTRRASPFLLWLVGITAVTLGWPLGSSATDFAAPKSYAVGTTPYFIVAGDFNGDGKTDLAVANVASNDISVLLNNGDGTFKTAVTSPAGTSALKMAAGDFNGDGKLDLAVINDSNNSTNPHGVFLLLGKGDGSFQAPVALTADSFPASIVVADFNEDGKPDLLLGDSSGGGLTLLLGKGDGTFQPPTLVQATGIFAAISVGDFNGDKHLDVVFGEIVPGIGVNSSRITLALLAGKGDGTFQAASGITILGAVGTGATVKAYNPRLLAADLNADGKLDFEIRYEQVATVRPPCGIPPICPTIRSEFLQAFLGNGDGTFAAPHAAVRYGALDGGSLGAADFNDDTKVDLLVPRSGMAFLLLGGGDGTFPALVAMGNGTGSFNSFAAAVDLNGDSLPDVVQADPANNAVLVFLNDSPKFGADLAVNLAPPPTTAVVGGGDLTYSVNVINEGPQDATGVSLKESLPNGLTLVSTNSSQGTCTGTTMITCELGAMRDPSMATVSFVVTPSAAGTLTDALQVSASTTDGNSKNNTASFTVDVTLPADISVTGNASKTVATAGDKVTYTLQVSNAGPGNSANVTLTDAISDSSLTPSSVTVSQGSCTPATGSLSCAFGAIAKGGKVSVNYALTLATAEIVTNGLSIISDTTDLNTADNSLTLTVAVDPANLSIVESVSANTVITGTPLNYTVTVTNKGPTQATNVAVYDSFQGTATATPTAATPSQGTCPPFDANSQNTTCALGTLAPNASATITFSATASKDGSLNNNATVKSDQPDPDMSDNSANSSATISLPPDFSITASSTSLSLTRGGQATETLTFPAQGVLTGTISLTCSVSGPSPMPGCSLSPGSVAPGGTSTLTISAASLAELAAPPPVFHDPGREFYAAWLPLSLLGLGLAGIGRKQRRGLWLLGMLLVVVASMSVACGGSSGPPPSQNYTVTVTATAGTTSHSIPIAVTLH